MLNEFLPGGGIWMACDHFQHGENDQTGERSSSNGSESCALTAKILKEKHAA